MSHDTYTVDYAPPYVTPTHPAAAPEWPGRPQAYGDIAAAAETCDPDPPRGSALVARPALGLWGLAAAAERSGSCPPYRSCESPRGSGPPRAAALREQRPRGAAAYPMVRLFSCPTTITVADSDR